MLSKLIFPLFFLFTAIAAERYRTASCRDYKTLPFLKPKNQSMPIPRPASGEPLTVIIGAEIMSVSLNEQEEVFKADFIFRQEWKDPRLAFKIIGGEEYRVIEDPASIWTPDLFFVGKINETSDNLTVKYFPDGRVFMTESVTVSAKCPVDLIRYPLDTQICELKIGSYGYTTDELIAQWNKTGNISAVTERLLNQNHTTSITSHMGINVFRDVSYTSPRIVFSLSRTSTVVIMRVLMPMIVIVACFWTSFSFTLEELGMRISLCVSPILTYMLQINFCVAFFISPSFLVSLDVWAITSVFALSLSAIECIYIFYKKPPGPNSERLSMKILIKKRITMMLIVTGLDTISILSVFLTRLL